MKKTPIKRKQKMIVDKNWFWNTKALVDILQLDQMMI